MKKARYLFLVLLPLMLIMGCSRRDILDDYPVNGIILQLDWEGVTEQLPERVRVIFYPKKNKGKKVDKYLPATGGKVEVPPGHYSLVVYNFDTEVVQVEDENAYETIKAYTGHCSGLGIKETETMVWGPDDFYTIALDDLTIGNEEELRTLTLKPKAVVTTYTVEVKAEGLKNVLTVIGSVTGMAECYSIGKDYGMCCDKPIYCETKIGNGVIKSSFTCFGNPNAVTRADISQFLNFIFIKVDGSRQEAKTEITTAVKPPESGEGEITPPSDIQIKLPDDEKIIIDDVEVPPSGSGGIGGEVGDWDDETDIELPVN